MGGQSSEGSAAGPPPPGRRRRPGPDGLPATGLGAGTRARGGEDLDVFARLLASGAAIVCEPGAILRHRHLRDQAALRRQLHGYGVGLGAALTKCVVGRALELAARLPAWPTCSARPRRRTGASSPTSRPS